MNTLNRKEEEVCAYSLAFLFILGLAGNIQAQITNRTNISIEIIWDSGFDTAFDTVQEGPWDHLYPFIDSLKGLIEWEVEVQRFGGWDVDVGAIAGGIDVKVGVTGSSAFLGEAGHRSRKFF